MANLNPLLQAYVIEKTGNIMTPRCRIVYPNLFEPTQVKGQGKAKYRLSLLIPRKADISVLIDAIDELAKDNLGSKFKSTKWRNPLLKVSDEPRFSELDAEFSWMIRPNSDNRPEVRSPAMRMIDSEQGADEVYGGRWGRASINPYWYSADKSPVPGVGLGLANVQLLDHDDPLGGGRVSADAEFEAVGDDGMAGMED